MTARLQFVRPGHVRLAARPEELMASMAAEPRVHVVYAPILDVARGVAAGFQAQVHHAAPCELDVHQASVLDHDTDGRLTAAALATALQAFPSLPRNTFVAMPLPAAVAGTDAVHRTLTAHGALHGVILDVTGFDAASPIGELDSALAAYRAVGAKISVGGHGAPQPELTSIVRLKPSIIRLGRDWVRGCDSSVATRSAIEVIGRLAGQLDAWILAEGVADSAELRALASLQVPLAQGQFIGETGPAWPAVDLTARTALPAAVPASDGVLRALVQQAYTATDAAPAFAVLPETTGFDVVVVLDEHRRPQSLLIQDGTDTWQACDVLNVNIDTPVADAVSRAMARPRSTRFTPLACTDAAGHFLGILRIERLMGHLAGAP